MNLADLTRYCGTTRHREAIAGGDTAQARVDASPLVNACFVLSSSGRFVVSPGATTVVLRGSIPRWLLTTGPGLL